MLGEGMEHVVEEANARIHVDGLRLALLFRMVRTTTGQQLRIRVGREVASVEIQGKLDLGLIGIAGNGCPAGG